MKVRINKSDVNRILLTELLPYEVPIIFSNEGFYNYKTEDSKPPIFVLELFKSSKDFIPYNYKIRKNSSSYRTLSIMHPNIQQDFIPFYIDYDSLLIHLCSRSVLSLRAPSKIASIFYQKHLISPQNEDASNVELVSEKDVDFASSYFAYGRYNLLSKFYDSNEFIKLEKKFKYLLTFDISKCFNSIYTHSIAWATKSKEYAKETKDYHNSFESRFDKLMSNANHGETNGIIIGPEISRIFAEVILQRIDVNVIKKLENENLFLGANYSVRRYVDDYFIFANDQETANLILRCFQEGLEEYRLHINESKTQELKLPFITGITISRIAIQNLFDEFFISIVDKSSELELDEEADLETKNKFYIKRIGYPDRVSIKLIKNIKSIVKSNNIEYESISSLILSIIKKKIKKIVLNKNYNHDHLDHDYILSNFLIVLLDVVFFIYSMDTRVRTTYLVSQIIISLNSFLKNCSLQVKDNIVKKIYDESFHLIKNITREEKKITVEILNLLVALKDLGEEYLLELDTFYKILNVERGNVDYFKKLDYFQIAITLFYIEDKPRYYELRLLLEENIVTRFKNERNPFAKTELTLLFFDSISCPYISVSAKNQIIEYAYKAKNKKKAMTQDVNQIKNYISKREWFINWNKDINLEKAFSKKELKTPY